MINFKFTRPRFVYAKEHGELARTLVLLYRPMIDDKTIDREAGMDDANEPTPGEVLKEWLELSGTSASAFSRLIPCSVSLPGQWVRGDANPSYRMSCRIEQITDGMVPRTLWYPPGPQAQTSQEIEDLI